MMTVVLTNQDIVKPTVTPTNQATPNSLTPSSNNMLDGINMLVQNLNTLIVNVKQLRTGATQLKNNVVDLKPEVTQGGNNMVQQNNTEVNFNFPEVFKLIYEVLDKLNTVNGEKKFKDVVTEIKKDKQQLENLITLWLNSNKNKLLVIQNVKP